MNLSAYVKNLGAHAKRGHPAAVHRQPESAFRDVGGTIRRTAAIAAGTQKRTQRTQTAQTVLRRSLAFRPNLSQEDAKDAKDAKNPPYLPTCPLVIQPRAARLSLSSFSQKVDRGRYRFCVLCAAVSGGLPASSQTAIRAPRQGRFTLYCKVLCIINSVTTCQGFLSGPVRGLMALIASARTTIDAEGRVVVKSARRSRTTKHRPRWPARCGGEKSRLVLTNGGSEGR